jgi:hypothetical protein
MKKWFVVVMVALALVVAGLWALQFFHVVQFFPVDSCLDSGGRWNYDESICER